MLGAGVFLLFGVVARRGAAAGFGGDPVPQALVITGLVVARGDRFGGRAAVAPPPDIRLRDAFTADAAVTADTAE